MARHSHYSPRTAIWFGANFFAVAFFLVMAWPLWNHQYSGGCYDAGDSFYLMDVALPILVVGLFVCVCGCLNVLLRRKLDRRRERLMRWIFVLCLWIAAALFTSEMIRLEDVPPC
jgi:hypothetical protein